MKTLDIIIQGADNGERMVVRYQTVKGTIIFGLAVPNLRSDADWDLGPTWCYLIAGRKTTLIDTGRFGNLEVITSLIRATGRELADIDRVIITHNHEDHDGNLAEVIGASGAELWAHPIYRPMIAYHPQILDGAIHPEMPGSCRICPLPERQYSNCYAYHRNRSLLDIDYEIDDDRTPPDADGLRFVFTPGHSPDSLCVILQDEALFAGDNILPDITPHPSLAYTYDVNRRILPEGYRGGNSVYGLKPYVNSLRKIALLHPRPFLATFPAHRLFYNGQFNFIHDSAERAVEIIQFHIERCRDILKLMGDGPATLEDITIQYFPPEQLAGTGKLVARDEIISHLEFLAECGDIRWIDGMNVAQRTGLDNYRTALSSYIPGSR